MTEDRGKYRVLRLPGGPLLAGGGADSLTRIERRKGLRGIDVRELWRFREVLWTLVERDLRVRYRQVALGAIWAILQPVSFTFVFTAVIGSSSEVQGAIHGTPYGLYTFCGCLPWQLFANSFSVASESLVQNQYLLRKVYFPRVFLPLAPVLTSLVDFALAGLILFVLMARHHLLPGWQIAFLPLLVVLTVAVAAAVGVFLAALNVAYRDVRHAVPFLAQIWLFLTPIFYPLALAQKKSWVLGPLTTLNPVTGIVEGFRWSILGGPAPLFLLATSVATTSVLLLGSLLYFRQVESRFADVV